MLSDESVKQVCPYSLRDHLEGPQQRNNKELTKITAAALARPSE